MEDVRTRFAPSPTGYMHIGGMRTALFNWLWARHNGGTFVLRIDDTDRERNVDEALEPILDAFRWLGLDWDEGPEVGGPHGPYFQSQRGELYAAAIETLLESGRAYRDFDPPELVREDREAAEREKRNYLNIRRSLDLTPEQIEDYAADGRAHVIRLLVPRENKVDVDDMVRGRVEWDCGLLPDPVLCRGDGSPLYNFACVVDDAAMQITHVIRAEEHLSNTPVQLLIYEALGYDVPRFAHVPYVAAPGTKEKLSKRDKALVKYRKNPQFQKMFTAGDEVFPQVGLGSSETLNPVMVAYYEKIGYLPEAVFNGLARLGWSLDDKTELMSRETIVENFTLDRVVNSPAGLDPDKLNSYQTHWMGELSTGDKVAGCLPYLEQAGVIDAGHADSDAIGEVVEVMGDRVKLFSDVLDARYFFAADDELEYDEKAFQKRIQKEGAPDLLAKYRARLAVAEPFEAAALEAGMKSFCEDEGIKLGDVIHAVRVAVTGQAKGPGMFETLELLGRDRCLSRIDLALERAASREV